VAAGAGPGNRRDFSKISLQNCANAFFTSVRRDILLRRSTTLPNKAVFAMNNDRRSHRPKAAVAASGSSGENSHIVSDAACFCIGLAVRRAGSINGVGIVGGSGPWQGQRLCS
jgi:hypothetical protein